MGAKRRVELYGTDVRFSLRAGPRQDKPEMSTLGRQRPKRQGPLTGLNASKRTSRFRPNQVIEAPCVDGSPLARTIERFCKAGRCGHVFDLLVRCA